MKFTGRAITIGNDVNTDLIFPSAAILKMNMHKEAQRDDYSEAIKTYGFQNLEIGREDLGKTAFLVAGEGLGGGSSRQYAVELIKVYGIKGVIAESIHPIFGKNLWNLGLFALKVNNASSLISTGDLLSVDLIDGVITNQIGGFNLYVTNPIPPLLVDMVRFGGLLGFLKNQDYVEGSRK